MQPTVSAGPCRFTIAFLGALTGENANIGRGPRDGAKLAVDQYNATRPECPVDLSELDTAGDAERAAVRAQEAVADTRVLAIVGPSFSGEAEAAIPFLDQGGVTVITPSATRTSLAEQGWRVFHRVTGNDAAQGPAAGQYLKRMVSARNVYVVNDLGAYGKGLADEVRKELGPLVIGNADVQQGQFDYRRLAAIVAASGADAVFYGGYYAEAGQLLKALRDAGSTAAFVTGDGARDPGLIEHAGAHAAEGAVITCQCLPPERARDGFLQRFQEHFGTYPGNYAAESYDAAQILLSGIQAGNKTRASLLAYVDAYDGDGITGHLKFDTRGELPVEAVKIWAYRVRDGRIVPDREITG
ncbi:branched-chain amino acid ABC transporter substrate-binding protein [Dactylosporangium sucinum]|uniref:branched-chain amino acid ABC transporter substrate-binding protein n=1 Tax=Dactylosporangium sucinum TaxID=1424081 RepID=UPI00167EE727|nr:branched-chain amino acid ABC transporter substrate-binding protein [Dactylosporangium sucinum]